MADPKRYTVLNALKTRLQGITIANGYYNDLATRIDLYRVAPLQLAELPRVNIVDQEDSLAEEAIGNTSIQDWYLKVNIEANVHFTQVLTLYKLMADIYNAIGGFRVSADPTLGGTVIWTYPERDTIEVDHLEKMIATASITVRIHYRYNKYAEP